LADALQRFVAAAVTRRADPRAPGRPSRVSES
jgi:hypothetical protein